MLILTRRVAEVLKINDDITITVLAVKGAQVKIGFEAPEHIKIHRKEIYDIIQAENKNSNVYPINKAIEPDKIENTIVKTRKRKVMVNN